MHIDSVILALIDSERLVYSSIATDYMGMTCASDGTRRTPGSYVTVLDLLLLTYILIIYIGIGLYFKDCR